MIGFKKKQKKEKATERIGIGNKKKKTHQKGFMIRLMKDMDDLDTMFKENLKFNDPKLMSTITLNLSPTDGLWKDKNHTFEIKIPKEYPIKPVKCVCKTKVWHPNIDLQGAVCLNILRKDWRPVLTLNTIFIGLHFLFLEPNPGDPLNEDAADQYEKHYNDFVSKAKRYTKGNYY